MTKKRHKKRSETFPTQDGSAPPNTANWWTRDESSNFLGVSIQTLRNYERRKRLTPAQVYRADNFGIERRVNVYDPEQVKKLPRGGKKQTFSGDIAATVFEMLNAGRNLRDIVIELREAPTKIKELHALWLEGESTTDSSRGEIAARCFTMLNEGKTRQEIVIALHATPEAIEDLHAKWMDQGGAELVITKTAKDALQKFLGPFKDVAELVELVERMSERAALNVSSLDVAVRKPEAVP